MKHIILPFLLAFIIKNASAQIVNIPDSNFKRILLNDMLINVNRDNEIQVSEALTVSSLSLSANNILDLTGIASFTRLVHFGIRGNPITTINLNGLDSLKWLDISFSTPLTSLQFTTKKLTNVNVNNTSLTTVDFSNQPNLGSLYCNGNYALTTINLTNCPALQYCLIDDNILTGINISTSPNMLYLDCSRNKLQQVTLSNMPNIIQAGFSYNPSLISLDLSRCGSMAPFEVSCSHDSALTYINLKNGVPGALLPSFYNVPNLRYICTDDEDVLATVNHVGQIFNFPTSVTINSYCSFTPGGTFNKMTGTVKYDGNNNGCDAADPAMNNLKIKLNDTAQTYYTTTNSQGQYNLYGYAGNYTVTPQLQNPYFTVSPASAPISFAANNGTVATQNFCITKNGVFNDLDITLVPNSKAKPGFTTFYGLIYTNKGTEPLSGMA